MTQLKLEHISKEWGHQELFSDVSFSVEYGEHIGFVGSNGAGKSTLLTMIMGKEKPSSGVISVPDSYSVKMLSQSPLSQEDLHNLSASDFTDEEKRFLRLLGFPLSEETSLLSLSGGEQNKLALALLLAQNPSLLLLDEPTNHLDFDGIMMLISILSSFPGTLIIVSHDRFFLDSLVDRIIEIAAGGICEYYGNYSSYRSEKKRLFEESVRRYDDHLKAKARVQEAISQKKAWSDKAHRESREPDASGNKMGVKEFKRAKAKKMDKKVKNDIARLERMIRDAEPKPVAEKSVRFQLDAKAAHGKRILEVWNLSKAFPGHVLFADSSFSIMRGEKVAVTGPNGCGKSTLISILQGEISADSGHFYMSPSSKPFVLQQSFLGFTDSCSVLAYLSRDRVITGADRAILASLGLSDRLLHQRIDLLSFGEQMKVKLAEPILSKTDFIIFDEPTNHLDLPMREMLEETLSQYPGTLLLISHDLYFQRKICNKVLLFDEGKIRRLEDSFEEYTDKLGIMQRLR